MGRGVVGGGCDRGTVLLLSSVSKFWRKMFVRRSLDQGLSIGLSRFEHSRFRSFTQSQHRQESITKNITDIIMESQSCCQSSVFVHDYFQAIDTNTPSPSIYYHDTSTTFAAKTSEQGLWYMHKEKPCQPGPVGNKLRTVR